jgi:hypothetical protein
VIILGITASSDKNAPSAPTIGTATDVGTGRAYNNAAVTVTFTAPTYSGGSPITSYTVTSNTGGYTATGASSPLTVTGIPSNTSLTFTVTATNSAGFTSPASSASNSVTATTVPQAPTIGTATALDASATVAFTAGATGGKAVSTYTATSSPGSITGSSATSPITVTGLTNGTAYTFTVTATNANGTSAASAASNSVTPAAAGAWDSIATINGNGSASSISFTSIPQTYKHLVIRYAVRRASGQGGGLTMTYNSIGGANYDGHIAYSVGTSRMQQTQFNASSNYIGNYVNSMASNFATTGEVVILNYSDIDYYKVMKFECNSSSISQPSYEFGGGILDVNPTTAISTVSITATSALSTDSVFALYGLKDS